MNKLIFQIISKRALRHFYLLSGASLLLLIFGCSGSHVRMYAGEDRPPEKSSVLKTGPNGNNLKLMAIDSKTKKNRGFYGSSWDGAFNVELEPGPHTFAFAYESGTGAISITDQYFSIDMKAGKTYLVNVKTQTKGEIFSQTKTWEAEILDPETNLPVAPSAHP